MAAIIGTASNDVLFGTGEDDYFDGKAGEDAFNGSLGNDTYLVTNPGTVIVEYPREGFDKAIVSFSYSLPANVENLDLEAGIFGRGNSLNNLLEGNRSNNVLRGVSGRDVLYGFDGNDRLDGGGGNDRLFGGGGRDTLIAGGGYDELDGGEGNDLYIVESYSFKIIERAGRSQDTLRIPLNYTLEKTGIENLVLLGRARFGTGNAGDNTIGGNRFANLLSGLEGDDTLLGDRGSDILYGNRGGDTLRGGAGNDQLFGQTGNDRLLGEQGDDQLVGENGNDVLNGWGGGKLERDRLTGGEGADRFVIGQRRDSAYLGAGYATIVDFDRSERDQIQIGSPINRYRLVNRNSIGEAKADTEIYKGRDLIAIVQDIELNRRDLIVAISLKRNPFESIAPFFGFTRFPNQKQRLGNFS
ncbi:MAG: calcium-binding protein [Leptolyngbyaceae cyanobacterium SM1_3_5]|nr:calcium-binding protein [Leptolyngbyaceae cyanobacterium SM1_3_5]